MFQTGSTENGAHSGALSMVDGTDLCPLLVELAGFWRDLSYTDRLEILEAARNLTPAEN